MRWVLIAALLAPLAALATSENDARAQAVSICKRQLQSVPKDKWEAGPCLSDGQNGLADWVVDVAHSPRKAVDDQADNQCPAFRSGKITTTGCAPSRRTSS